MPAETNHRLPDAFFVLPAPDVSTISAYKHHNADYGLSAIVEFGNEMRLHIRTAALARELIDAGLDALEILDPDGPLEKIRELIADLETVP